MFVENNRSDKVLNKYVKKRKGTDKRLCNRFLG